MWQLIARFLARPAVADWIIRRAMRRPYDFLVTCDGKIYKMPADFQTEEQPESYGYMRRWHLLYWRNVLEMRVHHIMAPDPGRDMHSHPWPFRTFILKGGYLERRQCDSGTVRRIRAPGDTSTMGRKAVHCIEQVAPDTWTLFVTFGRRGQWGFRVGGKMVDYKEYHG